ncbi:uncharacterized protein LOC124207310 [Daphnia pulex]|uniref:uncharacterized protein LOC124207310 n=1 Tax=Daphnia pulex TaxID=6669 RepID=UPI001EDE1728|nr:uncharacterized protein LOC124207310 [Daphnia pulex]
MQRSTSPTIDLVSENLFSVQTSENPRALDLLEKMLMFIPHKQIVVVDVLADLAHPDLEQDYESMTMQMSPFGIETPSSRRQRNHQNFFGKTWQHVYTPTRAASNKRSGNIAAAATTMPFRDPPLMLFPCTARPRPSPGYSRKTSQHVRQGVEDRSIAEGVVRRSLQHPDNAELLLLVVVPISLRFHECITTR